MRTWKDVWNKLKIKEIDGYIKRVRFLAPYEKSEPDIAFFSKLEGQKRANDRINQLAETKKGRNIYRYRKYNENFDKIL